MTANEMIAGKLHAADGPAAVAAVATETAAALENGAATLLEVTEALSPILTHTDAFVRERGVLFLAKVTEARVGSLNPQEASLLANFLINQLDQQLCVPHVALGIAALLTAGRLSDADIGALLRKIFAEVNVQSFSQTVRNRFFVIFDVIAARHIDYVRREMEADFLAGYIAAMDGEKDPRNLMVAFRTVTQLALHCDLATCAQDLFEVCFCYFPITFKPPPDDPSGISAADLKSALAACLAASSSFAGYAIPSLLEKLESTNANAKRDALAVLHLALPKYGAGPTLLAHVPRLWKALKNDIFHSVDAAHEELALTTLATLLRVLCITSESRTNPVDLILTPGMHECLTHLAQPETKLAKVSAHILRAFVRADPGIADSVIAKAAPLIITRFRAEELPAQQKTLVDALVQLVEGCAGHAAAPQPLRLLANDLYGCFFTAARSNITSMQILGLRGIYHTMAVRGLLAEDEAATYVQHLVAAIDMPNGGGSGAGASEVHREAMALLAKVAKQSPALVRGWVLPDLVRHLETATSHESAAPLNPVKLETLALLARESDLFADVVQALVARVHALATSTAVVGEGEDAGPLPDLLTTFGAVVHSAQTVHPDHLASIVVVQIDRLPEHAGATIAEVAAIMMRKLSPPESQSRILDQVFAGQWYAHARTFPVFVAIVGNARRTVSLPIPEADLLTSVLGNASLPAASVGQLIGTLANKSAAPEPILAHPHLAPILANPSDARALAILTWTAKGLLLRSHARGTALAGVLLDLLSGPAAWARAEAARGLGVLIGDCDQVLNRDSFAVVKLLYKQRLFHYCLPRIVAGAGSGDRDAYLLALGHLLQNVPQQVLLGSVKDLVPLLLAALSATDPDLLVSTASTFALMTKNAPAAVADHVAALVPLLLALANDGGRVHPMRVRIAALNTLAALATLKFAVLFPVKGSVLRGLAGAVDDPKRLVRRAAVNCRAQWYDVSAAATGV
ncbi:hypothetical protein H9P43_007431 [Blastocladiella emersonii ATCC 22665]|nr:hypothetical protein H9P43_007431 [Blastocladiella emersonii ATCC 22665]